MIDNVAEAQAAIVEAIRQHVGEVRNPKTHLLSKESGQRLVVRCDFDPIELDCSQGTEVLSSVTAKFFADAEAADASFGNLKLLHNALANESVPKFSIPDQVCFDEQNRLLLCRFCEGDVVDVSLGDTALQEILFCAGRALKQLHQLKLPELTGRNLSDHVAELIAPHPKKLATEFPEYQAVIEKTLSELQSDSIERSGFEAVPLHRDFQLRQLVVLNGKPKTKIAILDWDDMAAGDPLFDVVYLKNYLLNHLEQSRSRILFDSFMEGYGRELVETRPHEHWRLYSRFNYLRRACRRFRLKDTNWREEMREMLAQLT